MDDLRFIESNRFDSFGLGSLFLLFFIGTNRDISFILFFEIKQILIGLPVGLNLALGSAAVFLLYGIGRFLWIIGTNFTGLFFYKTVMRYGDFVKASASYKFRDWNLFLSLRRDLNFIDGLFGLVAVLLLFAILGSEAMTSGLIVYAATTLDA
ncbi:MAG: hypothetical protein H0T41_15810 [Rhodobacteraceae bacterium]|nr:hypothetical protein [Paracoccaceae bacterium]